MRRPFAIGVVAAGFVAGSALCQVLDRAPLFLVHVPRTMVIGPVQVTAQTRDENVDAVRWTVDDWSRLTPRPFELLFDAGPVPYERRVIAVALDKDRHPLYRQEAVLNPGGRRLGLEFRSPVDGQEAHGPTPVELRVRTPADDEPAEVLLDMGGTSVPLARSGPGVYTGKADVPAAEVAFLATMKTRRGRETQRTVIVNAPGVVADSEAHVIEQLVGVSKRGKPLEDLRKEDFTVRDEKGTCEVRDVELLRHAPLSIGFAMDVSISLRHIEELKKATADQFLERCFTDRDAGFVLSFGPVTSMIQDWTRSKAALQSSVRSLASYTVPGTALYEGVLRSLYQFQGSQGARALVLVTDGWDFEGDVSQASALEYARRAGVKIYALGLTSSQQQVTYVTGQDADGERKVVGTRSRTLIGPTNVEVLKLFTEATGGKLYLVKEASDLPEIYRSIERDIRTQYLVSYVSAAKRENAFHPVAVSARRGKVLTNPGFFY